MRFTNIPLKGAYLIDLDRKADSRGFFCRHYCEAEFAALGLNTHWPQVNHSLSVRKGTVRGLHFQKAPHSEFKLVRCIAGTIWDVIVDLRPDSATYSQHYATELSAENFRMLYVPNGFAHGFISLSERAELLYLVSHPHVPKAEGILRWNDSFHRIQWPTACEVISDKDAQAPDWVRGTGA